MASRKNVWQEICTRELGRCRTSAEWVRARRFLGSIRFIGGEEHQIEVPRIIVADCDFVDHSFDGFNLSKIYFARAILKDVKFSNTILDRSIFQNCDLAGVRLYSTSLVGVEFKSNCRGLEAIRFDDRSKLLINTENAEHLPNHLVERANSDRRRYGSGGQSHGKFYEAWSRLTNHGRDIKVIVALPFIWWLFWTAVNVILMRFFSSPSMWNIRGAATLSAQSMFGVDPSIPLNNSFVMTSFVVSAAGGIALISICAAAVTVKLLQNAQD